MRKLTLIIALFFCFSGLRSQGTDSLIVNYYENFPYAYSEAGKLKGIEIDIIEEYVTWLKQKKNMSLVVSYVPYKEFGPFYNAVKTGRSNVIGLGSVTINKEREKDVLFSPPYLQNLAVLITAGRVNTAKARNKEEVLKTLGGLNAMVVNKSTHVNYINDLRTAYLPALKITTTESQSKVLEGIVSDNKVFGYVDIVAYWSFLKSNPSKFLKIQKVFNEPKEYLGVVMPKNSIHNVNLSEFFESGFGFTSTKIYHQILEKYLGYEIIESVEIK